MKNNPVAGFNRQGGFGLNVFSEDELYEIHWATLDVLKNTGVRINSREAQDIFQAGGATVDRANNMVKIPAHLVEDAVRSAPKSLLLAGRNPKNDFVIQGRQVGFTNFGEGIMVIDPYTREYRKSTKQDTADAARVCDALDAIDVHERAVSAGDVPAEVAPLHEVEVNIANTSKHIFQGCGGVKNLRRIIDMAAAAVGGREKLRQRPIYSCITCPVSPLQLVPESTDVVIECAREGVPMNILSMALAGGTTPVTLAGTLITHNAEVLAGIVLSQLTAKGAPVIYGSSTTIMDLKYTTSPVGCPELGMINAAVAKLAQFYMLPSWVAGG